MATRFSKAVYNDPRWLALRAEKLRLANWRCAKCGAYAREVHHRIPLHRGGLAFPPLDGLRVLCSVCHIGQHRSAKHKAWRAILTRVRRETTDASVN